MVLSGGNVDASLLAECIRMGETSAGRRMVLATTVPDRPGALARLLALVAEHDGNVVDVEHLRDGIDLHVRETAIQLVMQTRGPEPLGRALRGSWRRRASRCGWSARASRYDGGLAPAPPREARAGPGQDGQQAERDRHAQHPDGDLHRLLQ